MRKKRVSLPTFEVWQTGEGKWRFQLIGANGEPLGDHYESSANVLRGIEDFKAAARSAKVVFLDGPPNRSGRAEPQPETDPLVDLVLP